MEGTTLHALVAIIAGEVKNATIKNINTIHREAARV